MTIEKAIKESGIKDFHGQDVNVEFKIGDWDHDETQLNPESKADLIAAWEEFCNENGWWRDCVTEVYE